MIKKPEPRLFTELAERCERFMGGTKRLYEIEPNKGDMWFFELYHHLKDCADALKAAEPRP
jgi:hypothetical protein